MARHLTHEEIKSSEIQRLITDMRDLNEVKKYGVGLAAPQIGVGVAVSVIGIKPTPNHPEFKPIEMVIINPQYQGVGRRTGLWEGCQSAGTGNNTLYGKALRYRHIRAQWVDEFCQRHDEELTGFVAHVFQHESDHLQGILFVDRVRDTQTYMLANEYRHHILKNKS
ncbi:peptide deformylase [Candidatus Saccharibacteria bacterium]|nr:MAG: peptide deformylase [Candidatus Saccharibacteria bacterium]